MGLSAYTTRRSGSTVLYEVVRENLETFLAVSNMEDGKGVPLYVEKEFRAYLKCGIHAYGFMRVRCEECGKEDLVAFSCKKRGFCPSCGGKRMNETSIHLSENLIPRLPCRQWVISFPHALRYWIASNPKLQTKVLEIVNRAISAFYKTRLREKYGKKNFHTGSVTLIQRFGDGLRLNTHFHGIFVDGAYTINDDKKVFYKAPGPKDHEIEIIVKKISTRIIRYLRKRGYLDNGCYDDEMQYDNPMFANLLAASVKNVVAMGPRRGQSIRKQIAPGWGYEEDIPELRGRLCAGVNGFSLYANTFIKRSQRKRLEGLCRYILRPAISLERLSSNECGRIVYKLKKRWLDGTSHVEFTQMEFMEKLAALVPPPRAHQVRYHGFLAPHFKNRNLVAKSRKMLADEESKTTSKDKAPKSLRITWAMLLKRTFNIDIEICPHCGGKRKILSAILDKESIRKILNHIGADPDPPETTPAKYDQLVCGF